MFYLVNSLGEAMLGLAAIFTPMALFHLIMLKKHKNCSLKTATPHIIAVYAFCFAVLFILSATGVPDVHNFKFIEGISLNLIPFKDIFKNYIQYVQNVLLFIPFGFLPPLLWREFEKKQPVFVSGFLFSFFIEIMQIFSYRTTDIDDLIMNTAGTVSGFYLFIFVKKIFPRITIFSNTRTGRWKWEPFFCFLLAWLVMFFVKPIILNLL